MDKVRKPSDSVIHHRQNPIESTKEASLAIGLIHTKFKTNWMFLDSFRKLHFYYEFYNIFFKMPVVHHVKVVQINRMVTVSVLCR
jgi:hypothetical protein